MSPTYTEGPNLTSLFYKTNHFDQEKFEKLEVQDFAVTMELHCNGKILNLQFLNKFLIKLIFFYKTDWLSLVLLYMWVTY